MSQLKTTTHPTLRAPCGRYRSRNGKPFTEQTLSDHLGNCPKCNSNRVVLDPGESGNLIDEFDTSDLPDGAYWALNAELNGDLDD